jgi:hypothetical protein
MIQTEEEQYKTMAVDKQDLVHALNVSVKELQQGIDKHCCLVAAILDGQVDERNLQPLLDLCPRRSGEPLMKAAIKEAIEVLEESRKAFKSKRLEALRKKLTQVLIDAD